MTQRTTKQLKLRRGNTAEHSNFVGAVGEITVDTDLKTIRVHDGSTAGGFPLMRGDATINSIPWTSVTNRPTLFSGAYADLTGKPTLFSGDYADLTNKPTLFSGDYADLTNKPTIPEVPTDVSAFTNDSEYVTSTQLSNSTAGLVQLLTNSLALKANINQIPVVPTDVSAFNNDANYATETYVNNEINSLINGAPGALNTLNELSLALSNDENFSTTVVNSLANKVNSDDLALVATTGSYTDLTNKPTVLAIAPQWTANHTLLPGGENTRYLVGDAVYNNGNIYVANYENESMPVSDPIYWTNIGTGNRLNIDGRDIPNITYDQLTNKPTIPADVSDLTDTTSLLSGGGINTGYFRFNNNILYTNAGQSIYIDPSNDEGDTGFIFVPGPGTADIDPVQIYNQLSGGVRIGSSDSLWTFGSSGTLTLPNNTTVGNNLEGTYSSSFLCLPWGVNDQTSGLFSSNSITRPLFNPLISTISVGWFVSGPGLSGVKEITDIVEMGEGDRAFIVDLTDGSLWADLSVNIPYRFYSPDYALTLNGTKLTVNSNEWKFNQAGHLTVPGDIHEKVGNDLEIAVHNNRNNDGTPGSAVLSLTNNDAVDSQTYTTLEVGAYGIKLNTDYEGVFTGARRTWEFKRNGTLTFPDLTEQTTAWTGSVSLISSGPTAPGSAVVAGENDVDFNFSDGVSTAVSVTRNSEIVSSKPAGLTLASNFDVKIVTDFTDNNRTWTFEGSTGNVELPRGSIIGETSNTTIITPPTATPDQSLVIRPTASQWTIESSGFVVYGSPITITLTLQSWTYFGTVNYEITGPGVTEQSLGRPLTGKLIYAGVYGGPDAQSVTWTIPAQSNITEFTFTVTGVDGVPSTGPGETDPALYYNFEFNAMPTGYATTVTNNGISNTEFSHIHLVAGDPVTVDLYLGDDDQYVKIEKNAGDVVIGTNANTKNWRFGTDGILTFPGGANIIDLPGATLDDSALILGAGTTINENVRAARIAVNGSVEGVAIGAGANDWTFTNDGKLHLPTGGDIVDSGGVSVLGGGGGFSGNYNDLTNKPTLFDGAYSSLTGTPTLATVATSGSYTDLSNTPAPYSLPTATGSVLGGVKIGPGISIDGNGVISTTNTTNQNTSTTSNVTFNNVTATGQIVESFQTYSTSIGSGETVTLNCANGNLWNVTSTVAGNWTAAVTNFAITLGQASSVTLIINQGATAHLPTTLTINGTATTINWQGGAVPVGNNNKKDIMSFSVLQTGASAYLVFGQLVTFG